MARLSRLCCHTESKVNQNTGHEIGSEMANIKKVRVTVK